MRTISIEWQTGTPRGRIEIADGRLVGTSIARGCGTVEGAGFVFESSCPCRLDVSICGERVSPGPNPTAITVRTAKNPFTVLLRDITRDCPVLIPEFGVVVTEQSDARSYAEIERDIRAKDLRTALQKIEEDPEETYENSAAHTLSLTCPTWLGLGRDMRIFEVGFRGGDDFWDWIQPRFHGMPVTIPEMDDQPFQYRFSFGRGMGCVSGLTRSLDQGVLPILHCELVDDDVLYLLTCFTTFETSLLTMANLRGTDYLVADGHGRGYRFTEGQQRSYEELLPVELDQPEETMLCCRVIAKNTAAVPRYAWFKTPSPSAGDHWELDGYTGVTSFTSGRAFCACRMDGRPMPREEVCVLLQPGASACFDFCLFHRPVSLERAVAASTRDFSAMLAECRAFWKTKLTSAGHIEVPERRVNDMVQAGLLHLDLVAYGLEADGPVAPSVGMYCPIGSESAPIVQFMDSMGWHKTARRCLDYFLAKQHEDGFIGNYLHYMLENGCVLWTLGEHYRYTRDTEWVRSIAPKVISACDFLIRWRNRRRAENPSGLGYGMIEGQSGIQEPICSFMLNGYAYLGLSRAAEMLADVDPDQSGRIATEAEDWRRCIRTALDEAIARSPVVPLGDGTWRPSVPPWPEMRGPACLLVEPRDCFTHGSFVVRDSLVGPLYLVMQEILDAHEPAAEWMARYHAEFMCVRNVATSQPYYCRNDWLHLKRGEVKASLKTYYNGFAGLADRETYTFWEHYFHASPHKTHEEAWFLMQTRWMLYLEDGRTLRLLAGIPRAWMKDGKSIALRNVATYLGPLSLQVDSRVSDGLITASINCGSDHPPDAVELRLPHPQGKKAVAARGGVYDPATESVHVDGFSGEAAIALRF